MSEKNGKEVLEPPIIYQTWSNDMSAVMVLLNKLLYSSYKKWTSEHFWTHFTHVAEAFCFLVPSKSEFVPERLCPLALAMPHDEATYQCKTKQKPHFRMKWGLMAWQRPTLPGLKPKYHRRWRA
jgi:hypothetical protein